FEGRDLAKLSSNALAEYRAKKVGFVFQFHHLLPAFTALENVMIPALIQRITIPEARRKSTEALDRVGLSHRITHRPGQLSGGEQQRVAIARAIVMEPRLLLADEPTGNLDSITGMAVHDLLLKLNSDLNMTMIVVTHNHDLAAMFSREVTMADGQIKEDKRRDENAV
ncbi:ABC transporter ATP-binding protein, partial [Myxococcota bacterium]|nr:ABC transporter ATP-binding protein [Myxococcota bacterium]